MSVARYLLFEDRPRKNRPIEKSKYKEVERQRKDINTKTENSRKRDEDRTKNKV